MKILSYHIHTGDVVWMYGTKCCAVKNQHDNQVSVTEMRMLRWMSGKTRRDMIMNDTIEKMVENRLRWFGHIERRPVDVVVQRVDQMEESQIIRGRGRPRKTMRNY
jgi:hypothetical protein